MKVLCCSGLALILALPVSGLTATKAVKQPAAVAQAAKTKPPAVASRKAPAGKRGKAAPAAEEILTDEAIFNRFSVLPEEVGYVVVDLETGAKLASHKELDPFIPASVAKVPTTVAGLHILGPEHRFETGLYLDKVPGLQVAPPDTVAITEEGKNGNGRDNIEIVYPVEGVTTSQVAAGNLYLRGGGDPFLTTADLMGLAAKLKKMGITRWTGDYYYDASLLANPERIDAGQEDDASYNPGISALSTDFNRYIFAWSPSKAGRGIAEVTTTPNLPSVDIHQSLLQLGWNNVSVLPSKPWEGMRIQSPPQPNGSVWLPVRQPGYHTALLFQKLCSNKGVELPAPKPAATPASAKAIVIHQSQPLIKLVGQTLEHSNNLMAEMIGMSASRQLTGQALSLTDSSAALAKWYQENLPHVNWQHYFMENHSGLSSQSQVTPDQMVNILRFADSQSFKDKPYISLLPISGWTGTLARRLGDHMTAMKVWAKTGTIHYSSGLAGYLFTQTKKRLAFAIFVTNYPERGRLTRDVTLHRPYSEAKAKTWNRRAKAVEDALVRRWIRQL